MGWITDHAPTDSELAACVHCGLCLPHCPTFRLSGMETASPRGRLMAMSAVAENLAPIDETFEEIVGACLQCRACEAVCPSLVPFGRAMEGTRAEVAAQRPSANRRLRQFLVGRALAWRGSVGFAARWGGRMGRGPLRFGIPGPLRRGAQGLRVGAGAAPASRGGTLPAHGPRFGRVAVFGGCVMDSWFTPVHHATIEVLRHAGFDVVVPRQQTCCGALAAHEGAAAAAGRLAKANVAAFVGAEEVVVNAAGCAAHLKEYGHWAGAAGAELAARTKEVTQIIDAALADGRLPEMTVPRGPVAVHDPCHNRHAQRIYDQPRRLLRAAGYEPVDVDPAGLCCGAAGTYSLQYPDIAHELGAAKAAQVAATGTTIVASANPGCEMQLRSHLASTYVVMHPIELYWDALERQMRGAAPHR